MNTPSNLTLCGGGWVARDRYGELRAYPRGWPLIDPTLKTLEQDASLFARRVPNYARFDYTARAVCCAAALALRDALRPVAQERHNEIGIVGVSRHGAQRAQQAYFSDYAQCGRTLGRGNLFIYTLPTSPLAEAAIYFGLGGPCFHLIPQRDPLATLLRAGARLLHEGACAELLLALIHADRCLVFLLAQRNPDNGFDVHPGLCSLESALAFAQAHPDPDFPLAANRLPSHQDAP